MKRALCIAICLSCPFFAASSQTGSASISLQTQSPPNSEAIIFKRAQPKGQRGIYDTKMAFNVDAQRPDPAQPKISIVFNMNMRSENEALATNSDGSWGLRTKLSNVRYEGTIDGNPFPLPPEASGPEEKSFITTFDKDGKIVRVSGLDGSDAEKAVSQMLEQLNPNSFLPLHLLKIGESWPFNQDMPLPVPGIQNQSIQISGKGTLIEVIRGQARLNYDMAIEVSGERVNGGGSGKAVVIYDLEKALIVSNKMEMKFEMNSPSATGAGRLKANMQIIMQVDLVNK